MLNLAQETGVKLNAIDVDVFACANAFEHANPEAKAHSVCLIDFGAADTTFAILNKGVLVFSREVAFGGNDLTELIKRKLVMPAEEAYKIHREPHLFQSLQVHLDSLVQQLI